MTEILAQVREFGSGSVEHEVRRIKTDEWIEHWPKISESLDRIRVFWEDYWTKESITECVVNGRWQAWGFGRERNLLNMIVLTQIVEYPANRFLQVLLAFGNHLDDILPTIEASLEKFAMLADCRYCEIVGRPGWRRKLKRFKCHAELMKAPVPRYGEH